MLWRTVLAFALAFSFVASCAVLNHQGIATGSTAQVFYPGFLVVVLVSRLFQPNVPAESIGFIVLTFATNVLLYSVPFLVVVSMIKLVKRTRSH